MDLRRIRRLTLGAATAMAMALVVPAIAAQTTLTREQQEQFLENAKIIHSKDIPKGITQPVRLTLSDGATTHDAAFSNVDEHQGIMRFADGRTELNFVDSYAYTIAAYKLAELLDVADMMPVTIFREVKHQKGVLSWWVDDVQFEEGQRLKQGIKPPNPDAWNDQMYRMRVFTQLVADEDRNVGNVLIDKDWKLWMIDFTRAFRRTKDLLAPNDIQRCDRKLLERLRGLTKEEVAEKTKGFLGGAEIDPLMARRDAIVALVDKLVAERGEARVLY